LYQSSDWLRRLSVLYQSSDWLRRLSVLYQSSDWLRRLGVLYQSSDWLRRLGVLYQSRNWLWRLFLVTGVCWTRECTVWMYWQWTTVVWNRMKCKCFWCFQMAEMLPGLEHHTVVKLASNAEGRHFLALTSDDCVFSWGDGDCGQLGLADLRSDLYCYLISDPVNIKPLIHEWVTCGVAVLIIIIIIIVKFVKRHTRSYRGASGGVNQVA